MTCNNAPDYVYITEWTEDDNEQGTISKRGISPDCGFSLVSSPGTNESVVLVNDTCVEEHPQNTTLLPTGASPTLPPSPTFPSMAPQFTGATGRLKVNFLTMTCSLLLMLSFLLPGASALYANIGSGGYSNAVVDSNKPLELRTIQARAEVPTFDWSKLARKNDINIWEVLQFLQKVASRKIADGVNSGTWWIEREEFVQGVLVNVQDILCKEFTAASLSPAQKALYKDRVFKKFQEGMVKQLMKMFTSPEEIAKLSAGQKSRAALVSSLFTNLAAEATTGWLHKQLPVLGKATSILCPKACDDRSVLRLYDPLNCGTCGHTVSVYSQGSVIAS